MLIRVVDRGAAYPLRIDPMIQQGAKLTGAGAVGPGRFAYSVALSADGDTALIGARYDTSDAGAAWVFTRSGATWSQQGAKLVGTGHIGEGEFAHVGEGEFGAERRALRRRRHGPDRRAGRRRRQGRCVGVHALGLDLVPAGHKAHRLE